MPSKNKNIIRRSKTRKQHRSRKHKRNNNNNNARNQTIRGGFRWPWRKPTPTLMETLKSNPNFLRKTPQRTSPSSPPQRSSQPRLPTNVDSVTIAAREEVSRGHREVINGLKKLIEPQTKKMKALDDEYKILRERKDKTEDRKERHQIFARRGQIRDEIGRIKREKIGRSRVEDIEKEIRTNEMEDASYRRIGKLPLLPTDDVLDAADAMKALDDGAGVFGVHLDKAAVNADVLLDAQRRRAERNQDDLIEAMGEMSVHRDSSPRGSPPSTPRSGSLARDAPLPPSGLPSLHRRARDSSARSSTPRRDSSARGSSARSPSP